MNIRVQIKLYIPSSTIEPNKISFKLPCALRNINAKTKTRPITYTPKQCFRYPISLNISI